MGKPIFPKESGMWVMLFVPFLTGIGVAWSQGALTYRLWQFAPTILILFSVLFLFLARQPLVMFLQSKIEGVFQYVPSPDSEGKDRRRVLFWFILYSHFGFLFLSPLFLFYKLYLLLPLGGISFFLLIINSAGSIWQLNTRWIWEISGILLLSLTAAVSHYVASGSLTSTAFLLWALNFLVLLSSVFYMKMRLRASRIEKEFRGIGERLRFGFPCLLYHSSLFAGILLLSFFKWVPFFLNLAYLPLVVRGIGGNLILKNVNPDLSKLGRKEMAYWVLSGFILVISYKMF